MSTSDCDRRCPDDGGFTLVEVLIALGLLAVVMTASLPAFLGMLRSSVATKLQTQGKNLAQERLEQMKDLRFHVDRQNGPFLDLLDIYYTNATAAGPTTTLSVGLTSLSGQYVSTAAASGGEPAAPFYRVQAASISGYTGFSQTVDTQFIAPDGSAVPKSRFEGIYDSQAAGVDAAPAGAVAITIITRWNEGTTARSLRTYTRITDGRPAAPLIQTQARAVAVDITSTGADGATLELQGGLSSADGAQSSGSSVSGFATGALATRTGFAAVSGLANKFALPTQLLISTNTGSPVSAGSGCSWYGWGSNGVSNGGGDVSLGLPKSPANVDLATPPNSMAGFISANGGGSCGQLSYDNLAGSGIPRVVSTADPLGFEMGGAPYVKALDVTGGSVQAILGSTYVSSNDLTATPQKSISGASAKSLQPVTLFPNNPESPGQGLVSMRLLSASVDCTSATTSGSLGTAVGKYSFQLGWWGSGSLDSVPRWHTATWNYDSSINAAPVLTAGSDVWDPANTSLGNSKKLSELIVAPASPAVPASLTTGATTGLRGFSDGIFSVTTASTLTNETAPNYSQIKVQIGQLTCVADDQR